MHTWRAVAAAGAAAAEAGATIGQLRRHVLAGLLHQPRQLPPVLEVLHGRLGTGVRDIQPIAATASTLQLESTTMHKQGRCKCKANNPAGRDRMLTASVIHRVSQETKLSPPGQTSSFHVIVHEAGCGSAVLTCGVKNVYDLPVAPARPVRPMRCT